MKDQSEYIYNLKCQLIQLGWMEEDATNAASKYKEKFLDTLEELTGANETIEELREVIALQSMELYEINEENNEHIRNRIKCDIERHILEKKLEKPVSNLRHANINWSKDE